jgi:hypothetical protein
MQLADGIQKGICPIFYERGSLGSIFKTVRSTRSSLSTAGFSIPEKLAGRNVKLGRTILVGLLSKVPL